MFQYLRNLTEKELLDLSIELKICFFIQGWNISANIKSLNDWINTFNIFFYPDENEGYGKTDKEKEKLAKDNMLNGFFSLYNFIDKYFKEK